MGEVKYGTAYQSTITVPRIAKTVKIGCAVRLSMVLKKPSTSVASIASMVKLC